MCNIYNNSEDDVRGIIQLKKLNCLHTQYDNLFMFYKLIIGEFKYTQYPTATTAMRGIVSLQVLKNHNEYVIF